MPPNEPEVVNLGVRTIEQLGCCGNFQQRFVFARDRPSVNAFHGTMCSILHTMQWDTNFGFGSTLPPPFSCRRCAVRVAFMNFCRRTIRAVRSPLAGCAGRFQTRGVFGQELHSKRGWPKTPTAPVVFVLIETLGKQAAASEVGRLFGRTIAFAAGGRGAEFRVRRQPIFIGGAGPSSVALTGWH